MTEAPNLVAALKGRWKGNSGIACCPAHNDKNPSLSIATGRNDKLLLTCHAGCDFRDILNALRSLGLLDGKSNDFQQTQIGEAAQRVAERVNIFRREKQARELWETARTPIGTIAETYLKPRGITCPVLYV